MRRFWQDVRTMEGGDRRAAGEGGAARRVSQDVRPVLRGEQEVSRTGSRGRASRKTPRPRQASSGTSCTWFATWPSWSARTSRRPRSGSPAMLGIAKLCLGGPRRPEGHRESPAPGPSLRAAGGQADRSPPSGVLGHAEGTGSSRRGGGGARADARGDRRAVPPEGGPSRRPDHGDQAAPRRGEAVRRDRRPGDGDSGRSSPGSCLITRKRSCSDTPWSWWPT